MEEESSKNLTTTSIPTLSPNSGQGEVSHEIPDLNIVPIEEEYHAEEENRPSNDGCQFISIDVGEYFVTEDVFQTKEELIVWAQEIGKKHKFVVLTSRSGNRKGGQKPRLELCCERSGVFRSHEKKDLVPKSHQPPIKKRKSSTKKCQCPFKLKGIPGVNDTWKVSVVSGIHNHELAESLLGHAYVNRLKPDEKAVVKHLLKIGSKPAQILSQIHEQFKDNTSTLKTIYNARANIRMENQEGRSPMQQVIKLLVEHHYVYHFSKNEDTDEVTNLFWAHPDCILLLQSFHTVLLLDCTYKTNRFNKPLLEIVGVTSTLKSFTAAFTFMDGETTNQYTWALNRLRTLFSPNSMPIVFITDRELALINAIGEVFPNAQRLLCTFHIDKCVVAKVKGHFKQEQFNVFMTMFRAIMYAETESGYNEAVETFVKFWSDTHHKDVSYVQDTWLGLKERFVTAWTNGVIHMGNTTTNRVEGAHSKLKRYLCSSEGNYVTCWEFMHIMTETETCEIITSFEHSRIKVKEGHQIKFFKELRGYVSHAALDLMVDEIDRANGIDINVQNCGCVLRYVYGLPCAHEMVSLMKQDKVCPKDIIHPQWTKLSINPTPPIHNDLDASHEMEHLYLMWDKSSDAERTAILEKLREISFPVMTNLCEPLQQTKTKGAPKQRRMSKKEKEAAKSTKRNPSAFEYAKCVDECVPSTQTVRKVNKVNKVTKAPKATVPNFERYKGHIPSVMHPFLDDIIDVPGDGHCGFHAVGKGLGFSLEDGWKQVRENVIKELEDQNTLYKEMFGIRDYNQTHSAANNFNFTCPEDWFYIHPNTSIVVASSFNCILVHLSYGCSTTFLPLLSGPPSEGYKIACITYTGGHFMNVKLKKDSILPPIAPQWSRYASVEATGWLPIVRDRIEDGKKFYSHDNSNEPSSSVINLSDD